MGRLIDLTGHTQSCGCFHKERTTNATHRERHTKLYGIWIAMRERCNSPKHISYKWYGAKGIKVCQEWNEHFEPFRDWAIENGYKEGLSIDRIDPNKDYSQENCRWLTKSENARISAKEMQKNRRQKNDKENQDK